MHPTVDFPVDELTDALRRTAEFLGANGIRLQRLTVTPGQPDRVTAVFPIDTPNTTIQRFTRAVRANRASAPMTPFHWQADGAGD